MDPKTEKALCDQNIAGGCGMGKDESRPSAASQRTEEKKRHQDKTRHQSQVVESLSGVSQKCWSWAGNKHQRFYNIARELSAGITLKTTELKEETASEQAEKVFQEH